MLLGNRANLLVAVAIVAVISMYLFSGPIPQDPGYHDFADKRSLFGISNFWNVMSNLPLLVIGAWGVAFVFRNHDITLPGLETAYIVFFSGVFLTALGSGYYHIAPANEPLVWDRLPMTIGFAGFFSVVVGEFVSPYAGRRLLIPMLLAGILAVEYWAWTEASNIGDLRPYAIVVFLPMLLVLAILFLYQPAIGSARYFWWMILCYALAKASEFLDAQIYAAGALLSGHSLKHLFAALTPALVLYMLRHRRGNSGGAADDT